MAKNKIIYIAAGIVGTLIVLSVLFALNSSQILRAFGVSKSAPIFTFSESKAPGWWAAENYNSRASADENYEGDEPVDKLPVASMNIFKGKEGEYRTDCFVMFSYYDYKADTAQLKKDKENQTSASMSMKNIGEDTLSIEVFGAPKSFTLTKYELSGPDAENAMKGMSYGWIDLDDGYISVSGVCPTGSEFDDTLVMISAMSLERYKMNTKSNPATH